MQSSSPRNRGKKLKFINTDLESIHSDGVQEFQPFTIPASQAQTVKQSGVFKPKKFANQVAN